MSRYRKIDPKVHGDEKFKRLTPPQPCGQFLFLYLLTCPDATNVPGLLTIGPAGIAEKLRWPLADFMKAFAEVLQEGLIEYDETAVLLVIPNAIKHNPPENPNVVKSWTTWIIEAPECPLKTKYIQSLKAFLKGFGKGFAEALLKPPAKPSRKTLPNQEQEKEQERSSKSAGRKSSKPNNDSRPGVPVVSPSPPSRAPRAGTSSKKSAAQKEEWEDAARETLPELDRRMEGGD